VRSQLKTRAPDEPVKPPRPTASNGAAALERLVPQTQKALVAFLQVDLDLSSTLLETAELSISRAHVETSLARVRRTLNVVRRLGTRINDPVAQADIHHRVDGLELRLETFPI
jgi:hypothetical protein